MMKNSKMGVGAASLLGAVVAAAALSGCTSSTHTAAGGGTSSASAAATGTAQSSAQSTATSGGGSQTTSTGTATDANTASPTAACTDAELKVTTDGLGAAASHSGWIVVFTNTGSATCTIEGYPGAAVTGTYGGVVLNATRAKSGYIGGQYPDPATIVLAPGKAASTVVEWDDATSDGRSPVGANCPGMDSGKVLITPPNTTGSTAFTVPAGLCSLFEVHPLVPGTSGRTAA
jgi:Protein of unknown function (DUF4232)